MTTTLHPHCSTCVNLHCREPTRPGTSCEVTSCSLACGASFHSCKAPEHRLLCPLEPVPCPSRCYGCPRSMPRAWVAHHLSTCPASVVQCKHTHIPNARPAGPHTLALAAGTPEKHSADAPHAAGVHGADAHTSGTNAPSHKRSKSIPNGENGVPCNTVTNGVSTERSIAEGAPARQPVAPAAAETDSHPDQLERAESNEGGSEAHQPASESGDSWEAGRHVSQPMTDFDVLPPCYDREARLQLLQRFLPPVLSARLANAPANHSGDQPGEGCSAGDCPGSVEPVAVAAETENAETSRGEMSLCPASISAAATAVDDEMASEGDQTPGQCSQLFRRDEFLWHSRNVHADLDLLEHACPLAAYGCPVSRRQLAARRGAHLVYDVRLGAFGLLPRAPAVAPDPQGLDRLSGLPLELQRHLLGYLDGYSLGQLALTSCRMREVCASLLRTRGMVELRWARCCHGDDDACGGGGGGGGHKHVWKVQDKVWRFSTAFSHVETWDLVEAPSLSNHLQCCPWNEVERPLEARALPCMSCTPEVERLKPVGACSPTGRSTRTRIHSFVMETLYWGCR